MATGEYTTLVEAFRAVPDPRKRRGQRYPWWLLLTADQRGAAQRSAPWPWDRTVGTRAQR